MNNVSRHQDTLAAFENNDPLASLHNKITKFQKKEKKKYQTRETKVEWTKTQRKLKDQEAELSQQILRSSQNILELMQNEMNHDKENVEPTCSQSNVISSMQGIISAMKRPTAFNTNTSLEELDALFAKLSKENTEHRREVMQLLRENDTSQAQLSQSISTAIESLRTLVQDNQHIDAREIDMLENDLQASLAEAQQQYDYTLQQITSQKMNEPKKWDEKSVLIFKKALALTSNGPNANKLLIKRLTRDLNKSDQEIVEYLDYYKHNKIQKQKAEAATGDYKQKCQMVEERALKDIKRLSKEFTAKCDQYKAKNDIELKSKEMNIKLKSLRLKHDERQKSDAEQQERAAIKQTEDEHKKKAYTTHRQTMAKQSIIQHQAQQLKQQEEIHANELRDDFINELDSLQQKKTNRERSEFRQEQIELKENSQRKSDMEALREVELRLSRLNALASSNPYYNNIMNKEADIHKTTFARKQDFFRRSQLPDHQSGNLKSFTTDHVFSDSKFRLSNALHEAGVSNTAYARDVIRQAIPRTEARTTGIQPY